MSPLVLPGCEEVDPRLVPSIGFYRVFEGFFGDSFVPVRGRLLFLLPGGAAQIYYVR